MQRNSGKRIQAGADLAGHDQSWLERAQRTPTAPGGDLARAITCREQRDAEDEAGAVAEHAPENTLDQACAVTGPPVGAPILNHGMGHG